MKNWLNKAYNDAKSLVKFIALQQYVRDNLTKNTYPKVVLKAWGQEEILAFGPYYCFKRIKINAGHQTSLQYHEEKSETNHLAEGTALYSWVDSNNDLQTQEVHAGFTVSISPGQIHRFKAVTDIVLLEASSPHIYDVVRLEDAYGRAGTSAP